MTREDIAIKDQIEDLIDQLVNLQCTKDVDYQTNPLVLRLKSELDILRTLLD